MRGPFAGLSALFFLAVFYVLAALHPSIHAGAQSTSLEEEVIIGAKGTTAIISKIGGNIRIFRGITKPGSNATLKTGEIAVSFSQLRELNSNLTQVVDPMNRTHTLKTFSDLTFQCSDDDNYTIPNSNNVTADCVLCFTSLKDVFTPTTFTIRACVIKQNGSINQQDEISNVTVGQLKFTVELQKAWPWCDGNCREGHGEYLDLDIAIKLPPGADRSMKPPSTLLPNQPKKFDLGAGAMVEFSTVAQLDGAFKNLARDTPSLVQKDGLNIITLRFPRFFANMLYDPTIDTGDKVYEISRSAAWKTSASFTFLIACIITLVGARLASQE